MNLDPYAQRLSIAVLEQDKAMFEDVCFDLECSQLESDYWPPDLFGFFIDALNDVSTCAVKGSSALLLTLYNDFGKLSKTQSADLLSLFDAGADAFGDETLRHAVADMVARKYPSETGMKLFTKWKESDSTRRQHMAQVGFEVLVMAGKLNEEFERVARRSLDELWQRHSSGRA